MKNYNPCAWNHKGQARTFTVTSVVKIFATFIIPKRPHGRIIPTAEMQPFVNGWDSSHPFNSLPSRDAE
jgi:hypothetical protein